MFQLARISPFVFAAWLAACQSASSPPTQPLRSSEGPTKTIFALLNGRTVLVRQHYLVGLKYADKSWHLKVIDANTYRLESSQNGEWIQVLEGQFNHPQATGVPGSSSFEETISVKDNVMTDIKRYDTGVATFTVTVGEGSCQVVTPPVSPFAVLPIRFVDGTCELR